MNKNLEEKLKNYEKFTDCPQCPSGGSIYKKKNKNEYKCTADIDKCSVLNLYRKLFPYASIKTQKIDKDHPFC